MLVNIAVDDAFVLGVLSSRVHVDWALAAGGATRRWKRSALQQNPLLRNLPLPRRHDPQQQQRIRDLAEQLDAHRKRQQAAASRSDPDRHVQRAGKAARRRSPRRPRNARSTTQGLVSVLRADSTTTSTGRLRRLRLGRSRAEDWSAGPVRTTPLPDKPEDQAEAEEELLTRLVALNAERAAKNNAARCAGCDPSSRTGRARPRQQTEQIALEPDDAAETAAPIAATETPLAQGARRASATGTRATQSGRSTARRRTTRPPLQKRPRRPRRGTARHTGLAGSIATTGGWTVR